MTDERQPASLEAKVKKWLDQGGYPLEMRIAQKLERRGLMVRQSDYFQDPRTEVYREIDVTTSIMNRIANVALTINFVIECKRNDGKPFVIFTSENPSNAAKQVNDMFGVIYSMIATKGFARLANKLLGKVVNKEIPLFIAPENVGYFVTTAFRGKMKFDTDPNRAQPSREEQKEDSKDLAFEALLGVMAAANASIRHIEANPTPEGFNISFAQLSIPIVVASGKLCVAHLDEHGETVVREVDSYPVYARNQGGTTYSCYVYYVSEAGFDAFVDDLIAKARAFLTSDITSDVAEVFGTKPG